MTLDSEHDRRFLLELISSAQISGQLVPFAADLIARVQRAGIAEQAVPDEVRGPMDRWSPDEPG